MAMAISPFFITGLTDAEGSFTASITRNPLSRLGYTVSLRFNITMHLRDSLLIKKIRSFFKNIGVYKESGSFCYFDVNSVADLGLIIEHFIKYPLLSSKRNSFYIFKIISEIIKTKQHLSPQGFLLVIAYVNILNTPIKIVTLSEIVNKFGPLPILSLCPVVLLSYRTVFLYLLKNP
jgi:LAGLIDADG endonuclease